MKKELWDDVIEESDKKLEKAKNLKETNKLLNKETKRVEKSIGWVEPITNKWKMENSNITKEEEAWDVNTEDGEVYEAESQFEAEVISYLARINTRLKRLEEQLNKERKNG